MRQPAPKLSDSFRKNVQEGGGISGFLQKTDAEILEGVGLAGNGGGWYWENVYRTNVQTAYNAGRAIAFEAEPPVALELVGIGDARQTEICRKLTQPPVRRLYADDFWRTHWPPFHFGCRTTVRAIYDPAELEEEPVTGIPEDLKKHAGFGTYPTASGNWWRELKAMAARAKKYGVQGEIEKAKKILIGGDEVPEKFDYIKALEEQDNDYDALTEIMEQNTTDAEKQALRDWTSNLYERINNYLRKNTADEKAKELAERIQGALEKCDVPPMYVKRGVNLDYFDILSGSKDWQKKPGVLRGLDFRSEGFFATSPNAAGGLPAECMLYLKVPEGTKGAYIGSLSHYSDERELLLQEGTRFAIWDARKVKEGGKEKYIIFADIEISQGEI